MLNSKKLVKVVAGLVAGLSLVGAGSTVVSAQSYNGVKLTPAEQVETSPVAKRGDKIFVVVKDTKKQTVPVVNSRNHKTGKQVKMGSTWRVKQTKKVRGKRIYRIGSQRKWLRATDVTKD